jgi:hypothetical protein
MGLGEIREERVGEEEERDPMNEIRAEVGIRRLATFPLLSRQILSPIGGP